MADPFEPVSFDEEAVDKAGEIGSSAEEEISSGFDAGIAAQQQAIAHLAAGQAAAAEAALKAAGLSTLAQLKFFRESKELLQPFVDFGVSALPAVKEAYGDTKALITPEGGNEEILAELEETPGFQFAQQEGEDAIAKAAAAPGGQALDSPRTVKDLLRFNQGLASQTLNAERAARATLFDQAMQQAGLGANAAGALAGQAGRTGTGLANTATSTGNALANIHTGTAANTASVFGNIAGLEAQRGTDLANLSLSRELGRQSIAAQMQQNRNNTNAQIWGALAGLAGGFFL